MVSKYTLAVRKCLHSRHGGVTFGSSGGEGRRNLPQKALDVPQLIIANGANNINGTARPDIYFQKYRRKGAPLTFVIQNRTPHCCVGTITPLMLVWLDAIIRERQPISDEL